MVSKQLTNVEKNSKTLQDFNSWLGTLPHKHKIVVNGNHESNSDWKADTATILSNATFLHAGAAVVEIEGKGSLKIYGTDFHWNAHGKNPYFDLIPTDVDVLVVHNPPRGLCDSSKGAEGAYKKAGGDPAMLEQLNSRLHPRLVVCGHLHMAHGRAFKAPPSSHKEKKYPCQIVNAAIAGRGHGIIGFEPELMVV